MVGHSTFSFTLSQIKCHPPRPLGILKVLILVLSVGFLRRYEQNCVVVQSQGDQPVVFEFLKIFIHGRLIASKRSGGFLLPPRWRHGSRAAGLRSARFVGLARLGLATVIHAASDCRGIYPLSLPL
nr:MAG TPA: hypothetical protein [Caudoviricetes sp.]